MKITDPRQIISNEKLQNAYLQLHAAGETQFTIQQLCRVADVSRPTFYKLFDDIEQLRLSLHKSIIKKLSEALAFDHPQSLKVITSEQLPKHFELLFAHIESNKIAYEILLVKEPDALFINAVKIVIHQFIVDGIHYAETLENNFRVEQDLVSAYVTGAFVDSIIYWIKENYATDANIMAKKLIEMTLFGLYIEQPKLGH